MKRFKLDYSVPECKPYMQKSPDGEYLKKEDVKKRLQELLDYNPGEVKASHLWNGINKLREELE